MSEIAPPLNACAEDEPPAGRRDAALVALLFGAGLRRSEAVTLDLADYDAGSGWLRVQGKGSKERLVYLAGGAAEAVSDRLEARGTEAGALLTPVRKGGRLEVRRLTDQAIYYALRRRADEVRLARCSPHDARRTFISELLDAGADLAAVQQLAGHASVMTTARAAVTPTTT